jgi:hypothetical protein
LMQYLGRITDAQIRTGLLVSGASREEQDCFAGAIRKRIERLRQVGGGVSGPAAGQSSRRYDGSSDYLTP